MSKNIIMIHNDEYVLWQCRTCGIYAICPNIVWDTHIEKGGYQFCPNGHQWGWSVNITSVPIVVEKKTISWIRKFGQKFIQTNIDPNLSDNIIKFKKKD